MQLWNPVGDALERIGDNRRDWSPTKDAWHYRAFKRWQHDTGNYDNRTNYCHYWHVAMFLWWFVKVRKVFKSEISMGVLLGVVVLSMASLIMAFIITNPPAVPLVLAGAYVLFGFKTAGHLLDIKDQGWIDDLPLVGRVMTYVFFSLVYPAVAALLLVVVVLFVLFGAESSRAPRLRGWMLLIPVAVVVAFVFGWIPLEVLPLAVLAVLVALILASMAMMMYDRHVQKHPAPQMEPMWPVRPQRVRRELRAPAPVRAVGDTFGLVIGRAAANKKKICPIIEVD